ncbi:C40 family peptidase [Agrilactobacillus yilanensis]|uniref:C40 family peptidase n=1 Tax=Agrilactobacillus yilanensis TaxID=2485997 RepID=A0ABW4J4A5_9LACO|nr:C40 family peptidase [Agrilactobacillus yilanensis]
MTHNKTLMTVSAGIAGLAGIALVNGHDNSKVQAATQTATVNYSQGTTTVWGSADFTQPKSYVSYQQTVDIYGSKQVGGTTWYLVGDNSWIPEIYLSFDNQTQNTPTDTTAVEQAPAEETPVADQNTATDATDNGGNVVTDTTNVSDTTTNETTENTNVTNTDLNKAAAVIALAKEQLGKPYVWGGKGPSSFDCSGLMHYVFANALGLEIGGWTVPQESAGTQISVSQAQPGDLIFWGSRGATYHVALYLGNNQYIDAPVPGRSVEIASISQYFMPSFAVRVL